MKPIILFLLLGSIALAVATYVPTRSPDEWRRRMMGPPAPTIPSWMVLPGLPTKYPRGYSFTDAESRLKSKQYLEQLEKERKEAEGDSQEGEIDVEKRRNLLVGRYGFRIGKRSADDEITEADYQELVAEDGVPIKPTPNYLQ